MLVKLYRLLTRLFLRCCRSGIPYQQPLIFMGDLVNLAKASQTLLSSSLRQEGM